MAHNLYEEYYMNQAGYGLPYYSGTPYMKGYGLGGILSGVLRSVVPLFKSAGKTLLREGLKTGTNILTDALDGRNIKESASQRLSQSAKQLTRRAADKLTKTLNKPSSSRGVKRKRKTQTVQKRRVKRKRDIFS